MKPADLRNATWREVQAHLGEDMLRVHAAWQEHGPGTTRAVADKSGISLLTLRPRTTDLFKLGLVSLVGKAEANEGVYAHVSMETAESAWVRGSQLSALNSQLPEAPPRLVNTLPAKDQLLAQIRRLPLDEQLSIAGSIRAAAQHTARPPAPNQSELTLA